MTIPTYGTAEHAALITKGRHPGVQTAMAWLCFSHLPSTLASLSRPLYEAALQELARIPDDSAELTGALNRLVEAKDWFMRAGIHSDQGKPGPVPRPATVVDPPVSTRWSWPTDRAQTGDQAARDVRDARPPVPPTDFATVDPMGDPFQDRPQA